MSLLTLQEANDLIRTEGAEAAHERYCIAGYIPIMNGSYEQNLACPHCAAERNAKDIQNAIRASGIGQRYWNVTWDDLQMVEPLPALKNASARIDRIISEGDSLILVGVGGTGKTQAAVLLLRAAIERQHTGAIVNIGRIAMQVRAGYDDHTTSEAQEVERLARVDLLVLDDVGAGEAGDAKIERRLLYFVTEARQNAQKPTIITSNLNLADLRAFLGDRVVNRLMPAATMVFAHGRNFRQPEGTRNLWEGTR